MKSNINEIKWNQWDGGMSDNSNERDLANGWFEYLENASVGDNTKVLKQVGDTVVQTSTRTMVALLTYGSYIYGLGEDPDTGKICLYQTYSNLTTPGTWTKLTITTNQDFSDIAGSVNPFFVYNNGYIYFDNYGYLGRYPTGAGTQDGDWCPGGTGNVRGGVAWNGYLWGWYGNQLQQFDPTEASAATQIAKVSVPTGQTIIELVPYGSLLAIICSADSSGESKMYLWDGANLSANPFYDIISIGTGYVAGGCVLDGILTVVIGSGINLRIKQYSGSRFDTVYYYDGREGSTGDTITDVVSRVKASKNFLYFIVGGSRPNSSVPYAYYMCRWGNKITGTQRSFCVYQNLNMTPAYSYTTPNSNRLSDFTIVEDLEPDYTTTYSTLVDSTSTPVIKEGYTKGFGASTSIAQTGIYSCGDASINKVLKGISLQYKGLSAGSITSYLRCDDSTPWVQIFTDTTVGSKNHRAVCIESDGSNLPTFKEIQFRTEMIGGQTLLSGKFKYEETIEENN